MMSQVLTLKSSAPNLGSQPRGYTPQEWEAVRPEITRLYGDHNIPLKDVVKIMKTSYSFFATERQYKTRIDRWGLSKKVKSNEMMAIVRKDRKRKLEEGKETAFVVRKRPVDPRKIARFVKHHDIPDFRSQMSPTPSVISYHTINQNRPSIVSSTEQNAQEPSDSHSQIDPAIPAILETASEIRPSLPESIQMTSMPPTVVAEETATSSNRHPGSKSTISEASFVNQPESKASTRDLIIMKEFFDFSAAAKTEGKSTSSITQLTSLEGGPHSKKLHKGIERHDLTSDSESESTALENLDSLIELAGTVEDQGRYEWSRVLLQRVVRLHRQRFGDTHPSTFGALEALSRILRRQGRYSEADQLLVGALRAFLSFRGPRSLETLLCMGLLALAKMDLGHHQLAADLARTAVGLGQESLDLNDPVLTRSKENLGMVLSFQGHHEAAEKIHREVLATRTDSLGADHPKTLNSMHNLAISLGGQKKYRTMESIYRDKARIESRTLGPQHPHTLNSIHGVATALAGQQRYVEAESIYREIVTLRRRVSGAEHPHTLTGTHNLAGILRDQGKHEEARILYNQLLEIEKRTIGPEHPWTLTTQANLVSVLECLGEDEDAEALSRQTLEARERVLGTEHTSTLASKNQLARLLEDMGAYEEALRLYGDVLEVREKVLGRGHVLTRSMEGCVGRVERAMREDVESIYSD